MTDLTLTDKEKATYITELKILKDTNQYQITYADKKVSCSPFFLHNYQIDERRMEKQYFNYASSFYTYVSGMEGTLFLSILRDIIMIGSILFLTVPKPDTHMSFKIFICLITLVVIFLRYKTFKKVHILQRKRKKLNIMKDYMEHQEFYQIEGIDPTTEERFIWNVLNLSDIDQFQTRKELEAYRQSLTPEEKETSIQEIQQLLLKNKKNDSI